MAGRASDVDDLSNLVPCEERLMKMNSTAGLERPGESCYFPMVCSNLDEEDGHSLMEMGFAFGRNVGRSCIHLDENQTGKAFAQV